MPYELLAEYYDHFFDRNAGMRRARKTVFGPLLRNVSAVCDLACGTGSWAVELASRGIYTFAVDLSPAMCALARRKAGEANVAVHVVTSDMRTFRLPRTVDLITCEFDALNHVPRKSDLGRVLKRAAQTLNPGGHFAFDVNNRPAFEQVWAHTWFLEKPPVALVMRGSYTPGRDRAALDLEWFVRTGGKNSWRRHHEHVEEVCWSADEIRAALDKAGLQVVGTWDAAPFFRDDFTRPGNRTYWLTQKPRQPEPTRKGLPASARSVRSRASRS